MYWGDTPGFGARAAFIVLPDGTFIQNCRALEGVMTVREYLAIQKRKKQEVQKKSKLKKTSSRRKP